MTQEHRIRRRSRMHREANGRVQENSVSDLCAAEDTASAREQFEAPDPLAQLTFIRNTMENAAVFTSVPGKAQVVIGFTAMVAAYIAAQVPLQQNSQRWISVWMVEAILAMGIALFAMYRKAARAGQSLFSGPGKKMVMNLTPPLFVGALLTVLLHHLDMNTPIPAMWLMLYGTAVISGGAFSVGIVPVMGVCFLALGSLSAFTPLSWVDWTMALGFGVLHIVFGGIIAKRHGG